jgi:predicted ATPase/DNA-binding CsgD family transcriptional regulator
VAQDTRSVREGAAGRRRPGLGRPRHNLPEPLSSFIGREAALAELERLQGATRLLTLTGPGGVGKTRLALQLAERLLPAYRHGAWLVELAALAEPRLVPAAVAAALGVHEQAGRPLVETLAARLARRELLLVLDNCEHLLTACAGLAERLLRGCPGLRIVATSRQPLGMAGETRWLVRPLALPAEAGGPAARLSDGEAVRLFVERARAVRPDFALTDRTASPVAEICRRLDGIPLAIELAAARVGLLAPEQIAARLDDRFRLLTGGSRNALPRHRTLRALVDWSHDLLSEPERVLFRRLSVFAGGWTLEAAEAVCHEQDALELLGQLVEKSLVAVDHQPAAPRYRMHETVRHYALERLEESGEAADVRRRHLDFYRALVEAAEPRLFGAEQQELLARLEREHDNLREALRRAAEGRDVELGLRLAGRLWRFWQVRGHLREGHAWLDRLLSRPDAATPTAGRATALNALGFLAFLQGDYDAARRPLEESLAIRRALDDRRGVVESLTNLGLLLRCRDRYEPARSHLEEALAQSRALGDPTWEGRVLNNLARLAFYAGDYVEARALHEASLAKERLVGNSWDIAIAQGDLADVAHATGDHAAARSLYAESLALWRVLRDERGIAQCLEGFALLDATAARPERAVRLLAAAALLRRRIAEPPSPARRMRLAQLLATARASLGEQAYDEVRAHGQAMSLEGAVRYALGRTQPEAAPTGAAAEPDHAGLSPREREVAAWVARGLTNRQIAAALVIGERTVDTHVRNILGKLGFDFRAQIASWATERGLAPPLPDWAPTPPRRAAPRRRSPRRGR